MDNILSDQLKQLQFQAEALDEFASDLIRGMVSLRIDRIKLSRRIKELEDKSAKDEEIKASLRAAIAEKEVKNLVDIKEA